MAVAQLLMDAETIYKISNELLSASSLPAALKGYRFVLKLLPTLASAYHQIGSTLSVSLFQVYRRLRCFESHRLPTVSK